MSWILDVVFFVALLIGAIIGAKIGFIKGVCKIAGWLLSLLVPFVCCAAFKDTLENWFGMVTALSDAVGSTLAGGWISMAISFVGLFIIVRLGTWLIGLLGNLIAESVKPVSIVNHILGALLGLVETFLILYFVLLICNWIPVESMHMFIEDSMVVGAIFRSDLMAFLPA